MIMRRGLVALITVAVLGIIIFSALFSQAGVTGNSVYSRFLSFFDKSSSSSGNQNLGSGDPFRIVKVYPAVAYHDDVGAKLKFVQCTKLDCSSSDAPKVLDTNVKGYGSLSMKYGVDGYPIIAYGWWNGVQPLHKLKIVHCTSKDCSTFDNPIDIQSSTSPNGFFRDIFLAVGSDGFPIVSYTMEFGPLRVIHCTNIECSTFDQPIVIPDPVGFSNSIAIGLDSFPIISYYSGSSIKVVHCTSVDCSTYDNPIILDSVNGGTSITIGLDNFPIVSYSSISNIPQSLKVVHCTSVDCSTHDSPLSLDQSDIIYIGEGAIDIGSDNFPIISYEYDMDPNPSNIMLNPKVVHCTSIDCSTFDQPVILDLNNSMDGGDYASISIGVDGYPIISYAMNGFAGGDLAVTHCNSFNCLSHSFPQILDSNLGLNYVDNSIGVSN